MNKIATNYLMNKKEIYGVQRRKSVKRKQEKYVKEDHKKSLNQKWHFDQNIFIATKKKLVEEPKS